MPAVIKSQSPAGSGSSASSLGSEHLEDDPSASGDKGILALAARNDSFVNLTNTDGDYSAISVDAKGRLAIAPAGAFAASGASTMIKNEDAAAASGDGGVMMLAVRRDTAGTVSGGTDGDYSEVQVDNTGRVRVVEDTPATLTGSADVSVDGTSGGVTVLASNSARKGLLIKNIGAASCRIGTAGTAPTASKGHQLASGEALFMVMPNCTTEAIKAIRETSTSTTLSVMELA